MAASDTAGTTGTGTGAARFVRGARGATGTVPHDAWRWWRPWSRRAAAPAAGQQPGRVREAAPEEDRGWRAAWAPGGQTERDLPPSDWRTLLQEAYEAYCANPLAYAVVEQSTNFVLGGGVRVVARDARVQR